MSITVTVQGNSINLLDNSLKIHQTANARSDASFVIYEVLQYTHYTKGQQVIVTDSILGILFAGNIDTSTETSLYPNSGILHSIVCVDNMSFADNRVMVTSDYTNLYSGDIAIDLLNTYLAAEGVTASYAIRNDNSQTLFGQGTLTNTAATSNIPGGDLELAPAGSIFSKTEDLTSDFSSGTLTNTVAANNQLNLNPIPTIMYQGTAAQNINDNYSYNKIWGGSIGISSGDTLRYYVNISSTSPEIKASVDITCSDGSTLRDYIDPTTSGPIPDQNGIPGHAKNDLSGYANDTRYFRSFDLSPLAGKTINQCVLSFEGDNPGTYTAYFDTIQLWNSSNAVKQTFFTGTLFANVQEGDIGYSYVTMNVVTAYATTGIRVSPAYSISATGIVRSSTISWTQGSQSIAQGFMTTNAGSTGANSVPYILIEISYDGGVTWQTCTPFSALPGLLPGANIGGMSILIRETLNIAGPDPTITPVLTALNISIQPSFSMTKTDVIKTYKNSTDWNSGLYNNLVSQNNALQLNGVFRNWSNNDYSNQTLFGDSSPTQRVKMGTLYVIVTNPGKYATSRLDFAGTWGGSNDFVAEITVSASSQGNCGLTYMTTNWGNTNNTYAYKAELTTSGVFLNVGSNSTGNNSYNQIGSANISFVADTFHLLKVYYNSSTDTHYIYVDDVLYIQVQDSTWTSAGYLGLSFYNNVQLPASGSAAFKNFGVLRQFNGTWTSPATTLSTVGTLGNSLIQWQATVPNNASLTIATSIDGGSTYQTCTNGGPIPGLTSGVGPIASLRVKVTVISNNATVTPIVTGITCWVIGKYTATGTRISPVLSLTPAGVAGNTSVSWNAVTPPNTSLTVATSQDNVTYTQIAVSGNALPNIVTQPQPTDDSFGSNTSANYTSGAIAGGTSTSWTWDTVNSAVYPTVNNGVNALLVLNTVTAKDQTVNINFLRCTAGGVAFRYTNASNMYLLKIFDSGAASNANTLVLYKIVSGVMTQITSGSILAPTNIYHVISITINGSTFTAYCDGVQSFSVTDTSITASGNVALYANGGNNYYQDIRVQPLGQSLSGINIYSKVTLTTTDPTATPQMTGLVVAARDPSIQSGSLIAQTNYQYQNTIAACLDDLCTQSNFWWNINNSKKLSFRGRNSVPSPWVASTLNQDFLITNLTVKDASPLYRSRQWVTGGQDTTASITETRVGDGVSTSWTLGYPVASLPTIMVNNIAQLVGVKGVDTGKAFYYAVGDPVITQSATAVPLVDLQTLVITYTGLFDVAVQANDTSEQSIYAALSGGSGIVEDLETLTTLNFKTLNKIAAQSLASSLLTRFEPRGKEITFSTYHSGLAPGQMLTVFLPQHNLIDVQFLISDMTIEIQTTASGSLMTTYTIIADTGPNIKDWTQFYLALLNSN